MQQVGQFAFGSKFDPSASLWEAFGLRLYPINTAYPRMFQWVKTLT